MVFDPSLRKSVGPVRITMEECFLARDRTRLAHRLALWVAVEATPRC